MTSTSERPSGRDSALLALDVLITALSVEKDTCGIPPAQIALRPAVALLNMIRVRFPYESVTRSSDSPLSRTPWLTNEWSILWGCMSSPRQGVGRETIGLTQQVRAWGHPKTYYVS